MPAADKVRQSDSILIVSSSEQLNAIVKRSLKGFITIDIVKSASQARRNLLERDYDLVVINAPLPDETGEYLAIDAAERSDASILLVVPQDISSQAMENVTDRGVLVLPKPFPTGYMDKAIRLLIAFRARMYVLEKKAQNAEEKLDELRVVSKAKLLLIENRHMSEDEAHRYIGKQAMDNGVSRKRVAERILEDYE